MGSNLGDKKAYLDMAVNCLSERDDCKVVSVSDYIVTEPYGGVVQDDFLNGALALRTLQEPQELLETLHGIEAARIGKEKCAGGRELWIWIFCCMTIWFMTAKI